jgi:hypothetical protein
MLPLAARDVYEEILVHINKQGHSYPDWYCGIASNWVSRLLIEHKIPKEGHPYIARQCYTSDDARSVENALLELGCDGVPGRGDKTSVYVYAYLKGTMTNP